MQMLLHLSMSIMMIGVLSGCIWVIPNPERSGDIYIDDPVISKSVDDQGNPIDPTTVFTNIDKQAYCSVSIRGPNGVRIGARWYRDGQLFYDEVLDLGMQRRAVWWIERKSGGGLLPGNYRVEIYLIKAPLKTIQFRVVE